MNKTNSKTSIATKIIFFASLLSILLFFFTPIFFIDRLSNGVDVVWGFDAILGISTTNDFNWYIYIACLIFLVIGFTTYYIGPKKRGYYVFAALVFLILAVVSFNCKNWFINASMHFDTTTLTKNSAHLGIGPWFAGIASIVSCLACVFDFRTFKLR